MAKLDAGNAKSAGDIKESNRVEVAGHFMAAVMEVKYNEKEGKLPSDIIECQVVGGTVPGQVGKEITMFLERDENGDFKKRHVRFAIASGLMQPGQVVDVDADFFQQAKGRYLVIRIEETKQKKYFVGGFGDDMWPVNDPEMAEIIRAMDGHAPDVMKRFAAGQQVGNGQQAGQQAGQQQTTPAQQAATRQTQPAQPTQPANAAAMAAAGAGVGNGVADGVNTWDDI